MNNVSTPKTAQIDELDLLLAKELELDARQSSNAIAKKLCVSNTTIQRRMQRLLDENIISIEAVPNPELLGFCTSVAMGLNVVPGKTQEVAKYLRSSKNTQFIAITTGRYDLFVLMTFRSPPDSIDFLDQELSRVPYLHRFETETVLRSTKVSWEYLNENTDPFRHPDPRILDELDIKLMKELQSFPRESVINLAKKIGVDRRVVSSRLQALRADNAIRVVSITKPWFFGFDVQAFIFVRVSPGKIMSVANGLVREKRLRNIAITTGSYQLILDAVFRDHHEMADFLTKRIGSYPGLISHETMVHAETIKNSFELFL